MALTVLHTHRAFQSISSWVVYPLYVGGIIFFSLFTDLYSSLQAVAKTSAAPIERIKLLVQNQDEMVGLLLLL